jgi:hypothetical protein
MTATGSEQLRRDWTRMSYFGNAPQALRKMRKRSAIWRILEMLGTDCIWRATSDCYHPANRSISYVGFKRKGRPPVNLHILSLTPLRGRLTPLGGGRKPGNVKQVSYNASVLGLPKAQRKVRIAPNTVGARQNFIGSGHEAKSPKTNFAIHLKCWNKTQSSMLPSPKGRPTSACT